jgi:hypothetical protein
MQDGYGGSFLKNKSYLDDGAENFVYQNGGDHVYKLRSPVSPTKDIKGIKLANRVLTQEFGAPDTRIMGYFKHPRSERLQPILKQTAIKNPKPTDPDVIDKFMTDRGYKFVNSSTYANDKYKISDLYPQNVLTDPNGKLNIIDAFVEKRNPLENLKSNFQSRQQLLDFLKQHGL